jgi:hypothetical protein
VATQAQLAQSALASFRTTDHDARSSAQAAVTRPQVSSVTALSLEFVATPEAVREVYSAIPRDINAGLRGVAGFAGSLTMISDQESRLVTVITFWTGDDRMWHSDRNAQWVRKLTLPYLDRCLRLQTFHAFLPAASTLVDAFSGKSLLQLSKAPSPGDDARRIG